MTEVKVVKVSDLDPSMFDVTNSAGDNLIKIIGQQNPAAEFKQVTNLDTDILGKGFVPFFGIVKKTEQKNVLNLPKYARFTRIESEKSSSPTEYVADDVVVVGYQITAKGNIEQRVAVGSQIWVRTNNGGTFNPQGELVTPNTNAWSAWVRDTIPEFLKVVRAQNSDIYSFEFSDNGIFRLKIASDEFSFRENYTGFSQYENLITKSEDGVFAGLRGAKKYQIVYVDNTNATGTEADNKRGDGTKANPYLNLEFLAGVIQHTRTIVMLKGGTGKVYELSNGRGREAEGTGIRIFTTYGSDYYDGMLEKYRSNPNKFSASHIHGFTDFPRATIRSVLTEHAEDGANKPLIGRFLEVNNGGVMIFENIDFECLPDAKGLNTDRGANSRKYGMFDNHGGAMVFNYCKFTIPTEASLGHQRVIPFDSRGGWGQRSNFVFNGCEFDVAGAVSALNPYAFMQVKVGDYVEINDQTVGSSDIPNEFAAKTMKQGNAVTTLATRRIALKTGVPQNLVLTNFPVEVLND